MNWTRAKNVVWEEFCEGGALLVNPATGARWTLNAAACALWKKCDGRLCTAELAEILQLTREEIANFCGQFQQLGLLTPSRIAIPASGAMMARSSVLAFKPLSLGNGPKRRPSARGVSGPA